MGAAKKKTYLNNLHGQLQPLLNQADEQMTPVLLNELAKKTQNLSFCSRLNRSNDDSLIQSLIQKNQIYKLVRIYNKAPKHTLKT